MYCSTIRPRSDGSRKGEREGEKWVGGGTAKKMKAGKRRSKSCIGRNFLADDLRIKIPFDNSHPLKLPFNYICLGFFMKDS